MINHCVLIGNLGADPEIKYSQNGEPIASMNFAFKSAKEKTSWIRLVCFGKLAPVCETYLHKGAKIAVTGVLEQERWQTNGENKSSYKIIVNNLEFIKTDGRGFENGKQSENNDDLPF